MLTVVRFVLALLFIAIGIGGYHTLSNMKRPPAEIGAGEIALPVRGQLLQADEIQVTLQGYGTARSRNRVPVSPEVGGRVVAIYDRLEDGEIIPRDTVLFEIDPRNYALRVETSKAEIVRQKAEITRIEQQLHNDSRRLELSRRARDLAAAEFQRASKLFLENEVGSQSGVELAERTLTQAEDQVVALENALALYPLQIAEIQAALRSAEVALDTAALDLERTVVTAAFDARLEDVALEKGQVVTPGQRVLTLVDDAVLEIPVPLDSREMSRWFPFAGDYGGGGGRGWFASFEAEIPVTVAWTEHPDTYRWTGRLWRVERFNPTASTAIVVAEVRAHQSASVNPPIVEGMFCSVEIPGRQARNVFRIPVEALSHQQTVFLAVEKRLRSIPVQVVHRNDRNAFIRGDLQDGDVLVTTKLASPLENSLLVVTLTDTGAESRE